MISKVLLDNELKQNRKEYRKNYKLMISSIGTKVHKEYTEDKEGSIECKLKESLPELIDYLEKSLSSR